MGNLNFKDQVQFPTVYKFCSQDLEIYLEVLVEIKESIKTIASLIENPQVIDPENLRFLRHKMKSTFRILEDDKFKQVLDDFAEAVLDSKKDLMEKSLPDLDQFCKDYEMSLADELEKHEGKG